MSLPALTKAYFTRGNIPFPDTSTAALVSKSAIWNIKAALCDQSVSGSTGGTRNANSIWTVVSSSDSVTANATDLWGSTFNSAKIVQNNNGSAHSWCLLKNVTLGYQLLLDCNSSTTANFRFAAADLSSSLFTGGTTTSGPTAVYEFQPATVSPTAATNYAFISDATTGGANYLHMTVDDTGQFHILLSRSSNAKFTSYLSMVKTINNYPTDARNCFLLATASNGTRGTPSIGTAAGDLGYYLSCSGRNPDSTIKNFGGIITPGWAGTAQTTVTVDALTNSYLTEEAHVISLTSQVAYRGKIPDLVSITNATIGASFPSAAAQDRIVAGNYVVPMNSVVPIV